jgi:hypothetical protein
MSFTLKNLMGLKLLLTPFFGTFLTPFLTPLFSKVAKWQSGN